MDLLLLEEIFFCGRCVSSFPSPGELAKYKKSVENVVGLFRFLKNVSRMEQLFSQKTDTL